MVIKHIKKVRDGKYEITFLSGEKLITYDEILLNDNILYKKELSDKEIKSIQSKNTFYDVYNNALKYISKKIRSTKEIEDYLSKYMLSIKDKKEVVKLLKEKGLLDDIKFAKAFTYDKLYLSNIGPFRIKKELLSHNIEESIIDDILSNIDYKELLDKLSKLVSKKLKNSKESSYTAKQKITNYFINLGYSKSMIDEVYNDNRDEDIYLEKEFDKVYKKLSLKETNKDILSLKIKQKLYQKGYSLSKIDELINKRL